MEQEIIRDEKGRFASGTCGNFKKGYKQTEEFVKKNKERMENRWKNLNEEDYKKICDKISKSKMGHEVSEETKELLRIQKKGKTYEEYYGEEIAKGMKKKQSISHLGGNSGSFKKGQISPNKGKHPSEKTRKKLSESHKGVFHSENWKKNMSKLMKGREILWKDKISKAHKGKRLSEEHKIKLKEARKRLVLPIKDTSIEVKIQNFLKQLQIEFFTHQYMHIEHGYQCDILIPSLNTIIECFGDYWHKYPIGREIDTSRCQELRKDGFRVLVFWEKEIKVMELNDFKEKLWDLKII